MVTVGCSDIERQKTVAKISQKESLTLYKDMNFSWYNVTYEERYTKNGRSGIAWLLAGVWKLRGIRKETGKSRCPLCLGKDYVRRSFLSCSETKKLRRKFEVKEG
jgi:hypothetical protein